MRRLLLVVSLFCYIQFDVKAEGGSCPDGYFPIGGQGVQGCAPIPGEPNSPPPPPGPQWATRWGAIAYDSKTGGLGGVEGLSSKRKAGKAATASCKKSGGRSCKVISSYYNQCGAIAWGNDHFVTWRGPLRSEIEQRAVSDCNQKGGDCKIFYSGCSYPERVR